MNVARLNEVQAAWMALSGNAPDAEKQRVFAMMRELPRSYISINDEGEATPMYHGQPTAIPQPLEDCKRNHPELAALGVAWQAPHWIKL